MILDDWADVAQFATGLLTAVIAFQALRIGRPCGQVGEAPGHLQFRIMYIMSIIRWLHHGLTGLIAANRQHRHPP